MLAHWEAAKKPLHIVPADEAIQRLLLRELQATSAPRYGKLVASRDEALKLLILHPAPLPHRF
jgi:hypothetical protein